MNNRTDGMIKAFVATTLIPRYAVVALTSVYGETRRATGSSQPLHGVSAEAVDAPIGHVTDILLGGIAEVRAGAVLAVGVKVTVDSTSRVVAHTTGSYIGVTQSAANAANDVITIEINKG
jgi:hypothetical protein